jgi:hypothetical protein
LTYFRKTEEIGNDGLATAIFVGTVRVKSVAATSRVQIDQRHGQIVTAVKPTENTRSDDFPFCIAVRSPSREASCDRCRGFQGLLVEGVGMLSLFAETGRADRTEMTSWCCLLHHQPAQGSQSSVDVGWRLRCHPYHYQGLWHARIIVGQPFLKPDPARRLDRRQARHQLVGEKISGFLSVKIIRDYSAVGA